MADHCSERIHEELKKEIAKNPSTDLSLAIEQVFLRVSIHLLIPYRSTASFG